jgi:serine/threonine protein phosphatase PrpC
MADNVFGITDLGKQRQNNEDAFIAEAGPDGRYIIACVIDGVGGYSGGEVAASIARESILQRLEVLFSKQPVAAGKMASLLIDAFNLANEKIWEEKESTKQHSKMACVLTLAVADIRANQFYYAHLGDTRLYLFRDGSLVKISHDQSFVGFLEDSGRLTEPEAMNHFKRNEIDKALGFRRKLNDIDDIETGQSPFLPGDMLLLCSDGLTDMVNKAAIAQVMTGSTSLTSIGAGLINAANEGGGSDNITVVLVKNGKDRQQHPATRPVENAQPQKPPARIGGKQTSSGGDKTDVKPSEKKNGGTSPIVWILVIGLAILCAWQYMHARRQDDPDTKKATIKPEKRSRNPQEEKLQAVINNNKTRMLVLSDTAFKSPVVLSEPIFIDRDSLYIKAKGNITFQADSGFSGPAFLVAAKTRKLVLDSLVFQNFNFAIAINNQWLQLKNMRFVDCKIQVQNMVGFPNNKYINGSISPSQFKIDSVPAKSKK